MEAKNKKTETEFKLIPIKKVLIALDYDNSAQKVVDRGYSLAKSMNAEVVLLHVIADELYYSTLGYSPIIGMTGFSNTDFSMLVNTEGLTKAAHYFLEKFKHHLQDESIQTHVEMGEFAETIMKSAKHFHADVIVIGSHSRRWLEQILMGSVTEKVLKLSKIPLFIIPIKQND